MRVFAQKSDGYPNLPDEKIEVLEVMSGYFFLRGSRRRYPFRDFDFYDEIGNKIPKRKLEEKIWT